VTIAERAALGSFSHVDALPEADALIAALDEQASLPAIQRLRATTAQLLRPRLGARLLDVGCGTGEVVRALAGVLHMFGVLQPGNEGLIPYMLRMYARRTRDAQRMKNTFAAATAFKTSISRSCALHFVGVWDTVSSYGWIYNPVRLPYTAQNPDMRNGRHAISIDSSRMASVSWLSTYVNSEDLASVAMAVAVVVGRVPAPAQRRPRMPSSSACWPSPSPWTRPRSPTSIRRG
jgi:SAM-dependent methyltransferase